MNEFWQTVVTAAGATVVVSSVLGVLNARRKVRNTRRLLVALTRGGAGTLGETLTRAMNGGGHRPAATCPHCGKPVITYQGQAYPCTSCNPWEAAYDTDRTDTTSS